MKMPQNAKSKRTNSLPAGALLCPICCVELETIEVDVEWEDKVLRNVKILRCPICKEEMIAPDPPKSK
jgi:hypothetical protein